MKKSLMICAAILLVVGTAQAQYKDRQEKKFIYMTSLGYSTGFGKIGLPNDNGDIFKTVYNKNRNMQIHQLLAYQFNNYFYMGVGAGLDFWNYTAFVPVYLNLSVNMTNTRVAPTAYLNLGYSFKWYLQSTPEKMDRVVHGTSTGLMGECGLGMRIRLGDKVSILVAGMYKAQFSDIRYTILRPEEQDMSAYSTNSVMDVLYHSAGIRVGIIY